MRSLVIYGEEDLRLEVAEMSFQLRPNEVCVRVAVGGICGSDLHYYNHGGFGSVRLKEPMVLGHEVAGHVVETGSAVSGFLPGDLVAISPSRPCHDCEYCKRGLQNHCDDMRFYGSAMPFPHVQGAFRQKIVVDTEQLVLAEGLSAAEAAMAEPLSVCLHAAQQAGDLLGRKVLISGCGPIGALMVLVARRAGAQSITVTDLEDFPLEKAKEVGADHVVNVSRSPEGLATFQAGKGQLDVHFECSGAAPALATGIAALRPGGTIVQVGLGGDMAVPIQALTAKELSLKGSFRFHHEFEKAVGLMRNRRINVKPLHTHTFALEDAVAAFERAGDRTTAMKVQLNFS